MTESQVEDVMQKMVSINKGGKLSPSRKASLDKLAQIVCPSGTCCITIWPSASAPTNGLTIAPCTNLVLYSSTDAIVAGCDVVAVTSSLPTYVSSGCSLASYTFTSVTPASTCENTAVCIQGGSNGPTALNIGPDTTHGCPTVISACECNAGAPGCTYPSSALVVPYVNNIYFTGCGTTQTVSTSTFDFTTTNPITLVGFISYGYCSGGGCAFSVSICLGGNTATCVADTLPYTTIVSGNTFNDNLCTGANFNVAPGTYSMTINFAPKSQNNLLTRDTGYVFPNAGITIAPSAQGTGNVPSDGYITFEASFASSDSDCA